MYIFYGMVQNTYATLNHDVPWNIPLIPCILLVTYFPIKRVVCIPRNFKEYSRVHCLLRAFSIEHNLCVDNGYSFLKENRLREAPSLTTFLQ